MLLLLDGLFLVEFSQLLLKGGFGFARALLELFVLGFECDALALELVQLAAQFNRSILFGTAQALLIGAVLRVKLLGLVLDLLLQEFLLLTSESDGLFIVDLPFEIFA